MTTLTTDNIYISIIVYVCRLVQTESICVLGAPSKSKLYYYYYSKHDKLRVGSVLYSYKLVFLSMICNQQTSRSIRCRFRFRLNINQHIIILYRIYKYIHIFGSGAQCISNNIGFILFWPSCEPRCLLDLCIFGSRIKECVYENCTEKTTVHDGKV